MTREEAIEVISQDIPCEHDKDLIEAFRMAIKALEQEYIVPKKEIDKIVKILMWFFRKYSEELKEEFKESIDGQTNEFIISMIVADEIYSKMNDIMPNMWYLYGFGSKGEEA